jgi:hypothetical protein
MLREIAENRRVWLGAALVAVLAVYLVSGPSAPEKAITTKISVAKEAGKGGGLETLTPENFREKIKAAKSALVMWYHSRFDGKPPFGNENGKRYMEQLKKELVDKPEDYYLLDIAKFNKPLKVLKEETNDVAHPCFVLYVKGEVVSIVKGSPKEEKWDAVLAKDKELILRSLEGKTGAN